jgi:hypothetical protein
MLGSQAGLESPMDQRIESFLGDASRSRAKSRTPSGRGCGSPSSTARRSSSLQEPKKRMRDQAAHGCRAL